MILSVLLILAQAQAMPPVASAPAPTAKPRKLCRRLPSTGSLAPSGICRTEAEWQAIDAAQRDAATRGTAALPVQLPR